jgi:hypothetical protein
MAKIHPYKLALWIKYILRNRRNNKRTNKRSENNKYNYDVYQIFQVLSLYIKKSLYDYKNINIQETCAKYYISINKNIASTVNFISQK